MNALSPTAYPRMSPKEASTVYLLHPSNIISPYLSIGSAVLLPSDQTPSYLIPNLHLTQVCYHFPTVIIPYVHYTMILAWTLNWWPLFSHASHLIRFQHQHRVSIQVTLPLHLHPWSLCLYLKRSHHPPYSSKSSLLSPTQRLCHLSINR